MKFIHLAVVFWIGFITSAQNVNQFDANGKRHGIWKKTYEGSNVLRYEGTFYHGKEIGDFKFYENNNNKAVLAATKSFNKENSEAYVKFYNASGKLISEGKMDGKKYIDKWKYYQNGTDKLLSVEHYNKNGELHGERKVFYKNGELAEEEHYVNGQLDGISKWYAENGVVLKAFTYKNDELHGISKYYNFKGDLLIEGKYKNGKKDGIWKYYEEGKLVKQEDFTYKPKYIKIDGKYKKAP